MSMLQKQLLGGGNAVAPARTGATSVPVGSALPEDIRQRILDDLLKTLPGNWLQRALGDKTYYDSIYKKIEELVSLHTKSVPQTNHAAAVKEIVNDTFGYGPIQPLLDDPEVDEIMVNAYNDVWTERRGVLRKEAGVQFRDSEHARNTLNKILAPLGREISESKPLVNARLRDGSRVNAGIHPVVLSGFSMTIRKFTKAYTLEDLLERGSLDERIAEFLRKAVESRISIVVSGGTGSGKTTLLNVISNFIPNNERVITIEDPIELQLQQEHTVRMEARPANMEGGGAVTIRDLVTNALRQRPDRIVVGEVRAEEALDMLQAMNTGHDGSLTTIHANTPRDAVNRLVTMVLLGGEGLTEQAIYSQIVGAVGLFVQTTRLPNGKRRITEIAEVSGVSSGRRATDRSVDLVPIFGYLRDKDKFIATGKIPKALIKFRHAEISMDRSAFDRDPDAERWEQENLNAQSE